MLAFGKSHQLFKGFCAQVMLDLAGIVGSNNRVHTHVSYTHLTLPTSDLV